MRQQALLGAVFADDVNAAFWSTPNTKGELGTESIPAPRCHPLLHVALPMFPNTTDRVELTKMFLEACIANGVDFPIVISCLDAGEWALH